MTLEWPHPERVHDLAQARLLPVRQSFLSGYPIQSLCAGLESVCIYHTMSGEAQRLLEWIRGCLCECDQCGDCAALQRL